MYIRPADRVKEKEAIRNLQELGIEIAFRENIHQKLAVIDNNIAWSGSLNILQHIKSHELMTRHNDPKFAKNLLEAAEVV